MQLTEKQIDKVRTKREEERDLQYNIINWKRPSLDTDEKLYDKLTSLQKSVGLFRKVDLFYRELKKKLWK